MGTVNIACDKPADLPEPRKEQVRQMLKGQKDFHHTNWETAPQTYAFDEMYVPIGIGWWIAGPYFADVHVWIRPDRRGDRATLEAALEALAIAMGQGHGVTGVGSLDVVGVTDPKLEEYLRSLFPKPGSLS